MQQYFRVSPVNPLLAVLRGDLHVLQRGPHIGMPISCMSEAKVLPFPRRTRC